MFEFLTNDELASKIRYIVTGKDVRCIVAYWSDHGFDNTEACQWKIVCDIHSGGTSPRALRKLSAPDNNNLFYSKGLHSKVWFSSHGAVVGSANASYRALNADGNSRIQTEAGVFILATSDLWAKVEEWVDLQINCATIVDQQALEIADVSYLRQKLQGGFESHDELSELIYYPKLYQHVTFLFYHTLRTKDQIKEDIAKLDVEEDVHPAYLNDWELKRCFSGWTENEILSLKTDIVSVYVGSRGGIQTAAHRLAYRFPKGGMFFTIQAQSREALALQKRLGNDAQILQRMARLLQERKGDNGVVLNSQEFFDLHQTAIVTL